VKKKKKSINRRRRSLHSSIHCTDSADDMEISVTDTRKKGQKRTNIDRFDVNEQNKVQIV